MFKKVNAIIPFVKSHKDFMTNIAIDIKETRFPDTTSTDKHFTTVVARTINSLLTEMDDHIDMVHSHTKNPEHYVISQNSINNQVLTINARGYQRTRGLTIVRSYLYDEIYRGNNNRKLLTACSIKTDFKNEINLWLDEFSSKLDRFGLPFFLSYCSSDSLSTEELQEYLEQKCFGYYDVPTFRDISHKLTAMLTREELAANKKMAKKMNEIRNDPSSYLVEVNVEHMYDIVRGGVTKNNFTAKDLEKMFNLLGFAMYDHVSRFFESRTNGTTFDDKFYIPHVYKLSSTGRLFGKGKFNLQTSKKTIRSHALCDYYDYDIDTSALSFLYQIAELEAIPALNSVPGKRKKIKYKDSFFKKYKKNKKLYRYLLAKLIYDLTIGYLDEVYFDDLSLEEQKDWIDRVKSAITALNFGAKMSTRVVRNKITKDVISIPSLVAIFAEKGPYKTEEENLSHGEHCAILLTKNTFFNGLAKELKQNCRYISKYYREILDNQGYLELIPGIRLDAMVPVNKNSTELKKIKNSKMMAYIYQANERRVLDVMVKFAGQNLLLPIHDGIAVKKQFSEHEIAKLQELIKAETNFSITLTCDEFKNGEKVDDLNLVELDPCQVFDAYVLTDLIYSNMKAHQAEMEKVVTDYMTYELAL